MSRTDVADERTSTETPPDTVTPPLTGRHRRVRRPSVRWGITTRILFWSTLTLAATVTVGVFAVRQVVRTQVTSRIDQALQREARELALLANDNDPETGEPFGSDVRAIFDVFLERNVPEPNEVYLTFLDGRPYRRSRPMPYPLDEEGAFLEHVAASTATLRDSYATPVGDVEYLAVPVVVDGRNAGTFVVLHFRDLEMAEALDRTTRTAIGVGILMLLISVLVIWRVAEGILRPVRETTETVRGISSTELGRRLPVSGNDEVADLARTFNGLLGKLEEAFETQRRFVDDAGHELRTPITIIRGHLELLEDDPTERERSLALVEGELERMQRIVEDLLTLAKAERPDFLSMDVIDLGQLTQELAEKARPLGDRAWVVDARARGTVVADRQRLSQAVLQLAQNAVQHTQPGAEIALGSEVRGGEARLWVRDTGTGIGAADLDRIFERFARGERRRASEGAGLGLSIVRPIAEAHHGRVDVRSTEGDGSTFTLVIPVDQPLEDDT